MAVIYYKTEKTSETGKKIQTLIDRGNIARVESEKLCKELGATLDYLKNERYVFGSGIVAVKFENEPNLKHWKKFNGWHGYYHPRLNSKIGKDLSDRFYLIDKVERSEIGESIGLKDFFKRPGFASDETYFGFSLQSDWEHKMPKDCLEITGSEYQNIEKS